MSRSRPTGPSGGSNRLGLSSEKALVVVAALRGATRIYEASPDMDFHGDIGGVELSGYRCHCDDQLLESGGLTANYGGNSYCFEHRRNGTVAVGERGLSGEAPRRWFCIANGELEEISC
ncbi:MAG: hypothetical protein ABIH90_00905 [Candidatus Aenigmatarchaeota archaeon]